MGIDPVNIALSAIVFFIYGSICILSLIFMFSIDAYRKIEGRADFTILSTPEANPILQRRIDIIDLWLIRNHTLVGLILVVLSIIDLKLWFQIINSSQI
ncbi:MAG: hypothetical protein FJZ15_07215 [Candidatus Omnitrophica bacterium]|nr:hypothetical protein [Candidatus Omnitrophota bacterium]